ncbi:hypothetical protein GQ53DRAFT_347010 [Thozetella sp. PMI_491]|nr:hypothetical protein GQ53DRAFT_347010 [Thozetella sp. PMI_491]
MQGDIVQLERVTLRLQEAHDMEYRPRGSRIADPRLTQSQVAIYNEDDLSHLLYADHGHTELHTIVREGKPTLHHPHHHDDFSELLDHPSGTHTPESETSESAILSDCESDDDENIIAPSPTRPRGGSICSDTAEYPVFLGRQAEPATTRRSPQPQQVLAQKPCLCSHPKAGSGKHVKLVLPEQHVTEIEGPMMSWWPAPLETMEHKWTEAKVQEKKVVPEEHHVSNIEGPLMAWWPPLSYEWSELFYE